MELCSRIGIGTAALGLFLTLGGSATAATLSVANHSFEASGLSGWSAVGNAGVFAPSIGVQVNSIPDGSRVAYVYLTGSITQDLGVPVQVGLNYQLDVHVGTQINSLGADYLVELLAGSTVIASASGTRARTDPFTLVSISGTGAGTGNITVRLSSTSNNSQPLFDNVQVRDASGGAVPEPSGVALAAAGFALLAWKRMSR